jgi:hypothetical protein
LGDLGVFGGQPGPYCCDEAGFGIWRWWVVGEGRDRTMDADESHQILATVDAFFG